MHDAIDSAAHLILFVTLMASATLGPIFFALRLLRNYVLPVAYPDCHRYIVDDCPQYVMPTCVDDGAPCELCGSPEEDHRPEARLDWHGDGPYCACDECSYPAYEPDVR